MRRGLVEQLEPPLLDLHAATWVERDQYRIRADARRFENWEANYAGKIGLAVAIDYALEWGLEAIWARVSSLATYLRSRLKELPSVTVRDLGAVQCGIVSLTVEGKDPYDIRRALLARKINVWVSEARSTRLDMEARGLGNLVRSSVHYYNSEKEVERFCEALTAII